MKRAPLKVSQPQYIQEWDDEFLALFPHRYDFIRADHPQPGASPNWQTESRYPLSDRQIQEGSFLYGVRFGALTQYMLLDIDRSSMYHPTVDPHAIPRMLERLEQLGLVESVVCISSYSGGLHLYFPFKQPQKSWQIAQAVELLLAQGGFKVAPGQLELFPNYRPFSGLIPATLYSAHRLPLQAGSYVLKRAPESRRGWEIMGWQQSLFVGCWRFAQRRNDLDATTLEKFLRSTRYESNHLSKRASEFLKDLSREIDQGWTGRGQTNYILGRIAMRSYIFGHVLKQRDFLEGDILIQDIIETAIQLPGYREYCQHQHEIAKRAEEWARSVEKSHYYHYGTRKTRKLAELEASASKRTSFNQQKLEEARERIRAAIADLLNCEALPIGATERFHLLTKNYHIGGRTLYKHRDLWHPDHLWKTPPNPLNVNNHALPDCAKGASEGNFDKSLLDPNDSNVLSQKDLSYLASISVGLVDNAYVQANNTLELDTSKLPLFSGKAEDGPGYIASIVRQIKHRRRANWLPNEPDSRSAEQLSLLDHGPDN